MTSAIVCDYFIFFLIGYPLNVCYKGRQYSYTSIKVKFGLFVSKLYTDTFIKSVSAPLFLLGC